MALVVEAKPRRETQRPSGGKIPCRDGRKILGRFAKTKAVAVAQASIQFNAGDEIFRADVAAAGRGLERERPAGADRVAKLPGFVREVFHGQGIDRDIPAAEGFGEQKFHFELVNVLAARVGVRGGVIAFNVVAFHFFEDFVRAAGVLKFDVEDRVDRMLARQQAEAIFPTHTGEEGAVVKGGLSCEIELRGVPRGYSVLEFGPEGVEIAGVALRSERRKICEIKTSRFLEVVIVGDDVGTFLREGRRAERHRTAERERAEKTQA